jgi:two-component system, sensor histidine kinase RpfC
MSGSAVENDSGTTLAYFSTQAILVHLKQRNLIMSGTLNALRRLKAHLHQRADLEHEQALLRIVIVAVVLVYMALHYAPGREGDDRSIAILMSTLAIDLAFAFCVFAAICIWPAINVPRRIAGMLADALTATTVVLTTNEAGVAMIGVYLFITFGNGFRYGRRYLFACQSLCLAGFAVALLFAPYWQLHQVSGWSLFIALVILPLYVSTLLTRIQEARAKAEEANRAKSTFLANMSHEMRTPLNGIVGVVDLISVTKLDAQQSDLIRLMRHSVGVMRSLIDDVLDISKIEAGRLTIEELDFDLHATINGLVRLLRPHAIAKGLRFTALVDPSIDYSLRGDPHHLRQVLLNLTSNAIKFTQQGEICVCVTLVGQTATEVRVRFEVRDTGIGIPEDAQRLIFERFVQADQSTTRRYGGTGLGTTIAKQLVELMGGTIGLTSQLGIGSTFWFETPLRIVALSTDFEPSASVAALLLADGQIADRVAPAIREACGHVETVATTAALLSRLRSLEAEGVRVPAVLVSGDAETASDVFEAVAAARGDNPVAMIYLTPTSPTGADTGNNRVEIRNGISALPSDTPYRLLRNAIHAATAQETDGARVIDLGQVLAEKRVSRRILVAEDNSTNRAIMTQLLQSAGHKVLLAEDGEEALDIYEHESPEIAILDFNMPLRNGFDVTKAIRAMEATGEHLPILILSATVTPEARETARRAGADDFIGKPYESTALLQAIDRIARRATKPQAIRSPDETHRRAIITHLAPIIDARRLSDVAKIAGDDAFLSRLLEGFQDDVKRLVARLDLAVDSERFIEAADIAHAVKGAALSVGASQLAAVCDAVNTAAHAGRADHLRTHTIEIKDCFARTVAELDAYSSRNCRVSL